MKVDYTTFIKIKKNYMTIKTIYFSYSTNNIPSFVKPYKLLAATTHPILTQRQESDHLPTILSLRKALPPVRSQLSAPFSAHRPAEEICFYNHRLSISPVYEIIIDRATDGRTHQQTNTTEQQTDMRKNLFISHSK